MNFVVVVKPTHICNLACTYCYNDDVRDPIMKDETLERMIDQCVDYVTRLPSQFNEIEFIWHGGEPMVPGLKFYEKVMAHQKRHGDRVHFKNHIQTNGVLINDKWIEFFKKHHFGISISIDGPKDLHDKFRLDHRGRGSFDRVFRGIQKVHEARLNPGVCVVASKANINRLTEIYDFLAENDLPFNIIPMNKSGGARDHYDDVGLDADEYGDGWIAMYDRWFDSNPRYVYVQDFVLKTRAIIQGRPADCIGLSHCADTNVSIDPVGDVYPCASLSGHQDTKYGNLMVDDLVNLMHSDIAHDYRDRDIDPQCATCKWQHVCHGGCLARSYKFYGNHHQRDYYCPSLYKMYEHVEKRLAEHGIRAGDPHPDHVDSEHFAKVLGVERPTREKRTARPFPVKVVVER